MSIKKIFLSFILLAAVTLTGVFVGYFYVEKQILTPATRSGGQKLMVINEGDSIDAIAKNLEEKGLIKKAFYFKFYLWQSKVASRIQAGQYLLNPQMSIPEIAEILAAGKVVPEDVWVTVSEGLTNKQIDGKLANAGLIKSGELVNYKLENLLAVKGDDKVDLSSLYAFLSAAFDNSMPFDFLADKPKDAGLEGFLFPDTYRFAKNATVNDVVVKMLGNFEKKLDGQMVEDAKKITLSYKDIKQPTIYEIVTLASIVQREVRGEKDMKIVAGIFYNRLNQGMPLEADSTLGFVTSSRRDRATYEELKIDSPYNTYKYPGLPPTPISNPGLDALNAAIYPTKTDYFYFLTTPDGKVIFSKTYREHLKNKVKWLD